MIKLTQALRGTWWTVAIYGALAGIIGFGGAKVASTAAADEVAKNVVEQLGESPPDAEQPEVPIADPSDVDTDTGTTGEDLIAAGVPAALAALLQALAVKSTKQKDEQLAAADQRILWVGVKDFGGKHRALAISKEGSSSSYFVYFDDGDKPRWVDDGRITSIELSASKPTLD